MRRIAREAVLSERTACGAELPTNYVDAYVPSCYSDPLPAAGDTTGTSAKPTASKLACHANGGFHLIGARVVCARPICAAKLWHE